MTDFRTRIAVLDYGMGNLHSVAKALEHVAPGAKVDITSSADDVADADRVVFPGVGAMRDCMAGIVEHRFDEAVKQAVEEKPVLAICVGMQALFEFSDENDGTECMGVLPGRIRYFGNELTSASGERLKVPHMGWNQVHQSVDHPLWKGIEQDSRFYFVHGYYLDADHPNTIGVTDYGVQIAAVVADKNLVAVQFHPEKSHTDGLRLLKNFVNWGGA